MNIDVIRKILKYREVNILDIAFKSSVLIPLIQINNELHIIFEVRSKNLKNQPGEICFPGGKIEKNESPLNCAVRETCEELNISQYNIEIIKELDLLVTPFNMAIYSFCGVLKNIDYNCISFNKDEVSSLFSVPLVDLLNQDPKVSNMDIHVTPQDAFPFHLIQDGNAYNWKTGSYPTYFYRYKNYIIWGITAKILKSFLDTINQSL